MVSLLWWKYVPTFKIEWILRFTDQFGYYGYYVTHELEIISVGRRRSVFFKSDHQLLPILDDSLYHLVRGILEDYFDCVVAGQSKPVDSFSRRLSVEQ